MKPRRIGRLVKILTALQSGKTCTVSDLSKIFGASRRTIFRDLKELQVIGVRCLYDSKARSYVLDPEFFLPPLDFNLQEALSLLLLVRKTTKYIQTPFRNSALLAALKIENNLPTKIRKYCNESLKNITAHPSPQAPLETLDKTLAELQKATAKKQKVYILYNSLFEGKVIEAELHPYHLFYNQRAWYVLGYSNLHNSIRTFKLNRIRELNISEERFADGEDFDIHEYLGRAWSIIPEGRIYNVKLKFLPKVANNVSEVCWHSTQKVYHNRDGSVIMEFRVDGLTEIMWWVLGYGDQVRILKPKILRERVAKIAQRMVELNKNIN